MIYDGQSLIYSGQTKTYPAVIDTGSSFLAVPPEEYNTLRDKWKNDVENLDCQSTFCQINQNCSIVAAKIKPVSF
jgi:predicted aspartyl protease